MKPPLRIAVLLVGVAAFVGAVPSASGQSLRGSNASVKLMHRSAIRGGLDFFETNAQVRRAVARRELVILKGNANYAVANVRSPYVRPETRAFVTKFAAQYRRGCGARLVVTSATRPMSRRLANGSALSVHPTGIAVDLRRPTGRCLTWLRRTLLAAERRGTIEATEERRPPHFHVAVLPSRYQRAAASPSRPTAGRQTRTTRTTR